MSKSTKHLDTTDTPGPAFSRRAFGAGSLAAVAAGAFGGQRVLARATPSLSEQDLIYMPASVQLDLFRARQLSPVEVLEAQIARHEAVNSKVNCTTYTFFEKARKEAKVSEARWMRGTARPLEGITCALKDEHHEAGMKVTLGSIMEKDNVKDYSDELTVKLKAAGCVTHMQTAVPEFYLHGLTFTRLWGVTRNPWNLKYGVGGSSGGLGSGAVGRYDNHRNRIRHGRIGKNSFGLQRALRLQATFRSHLDGNPTVGFFWHRTDGAEFCRYGNDAERAIWADATCPGNAPPDRYAA